MQKRKLPTTFKKVMFVILTILLFLIIGIILYMDQDTRDKYDPVDFDEATIPHFEEVTVPFVTAYQAGKSLPVLGAAIMDIDQDGVEELLVGGGSGQKDAILRFESGQFKESAADFSFEKNIEETTYGFAVIDMTGDGRADLLAAREGGLYLYENRDGQLAAPQNLELTFDEKSQPISIAVADLNRDGWTDLFVSTYLKKQLVEGQTIFNQKDYGAKSRLFLNEGANVFRDITSEAGLQFTHNTFTAIFVDLNNDGLEDLVVAYDTGEPRIYRNAGDLIFQLIEQPLTGLYSYPMGIAVGDYDNNGYQDLFFSNVGSSLPETLVRGDLRSDQSLVTDWILLSNKGAFHFENASTAAKVANYEFSWGAVFEDFNLDGLQDLVVSENYVELLNGKIRPLPSRFLMQLPNHTFTNIETKNHTLNPCNGITPLVADFNNDGSPDLVHINLNGAVKAFISKANVGNNFLKIQLPETPAYINAIVSVLKQDGSRITLQKVHGEGLASEQSHTLFFGLGRDTSIQSCRLRKVDGTGKEIEVSGVNKTIFIE